MRQKRGQKIKNESFERGDPRRWMPGPGSIRNIEATKGKCFFLAVGTHWPRLRLFVKPEANTVNTDEYLKHPANRRDMILSIMRDRAAREDAALTASQRTS